MTSASSPRQSSIAASGCSPAIHCPDGDDGMGRADDFGGRVQRDAEPAGGARVERREGARVDRHGVFSVIGTRARRLEFCDIGKIGKLAGRRESGNEGRKFVAVARQQRRTRRLLCHEGARHRREKLFADNLLGRGKAAPERLRQAGHDIVAVDRKAPRCRLRIRRGDGIGNGRGGVEQRAGERCFERAVTADPHAADARAARARISSAATACARASASRERRCPTRGGSRSARYGRRHRRRAPRPRPRPAIRARR